MKTNTKSKFLIPLLVFILMPSCEKTEHESFFYYDYREVPVNGTVLIGPKTGSGNYTLEVENPLLFSAEM